ncbi:MAG: beta-lactamase family protein, partial [Gemmatimonadota bacterium]|nr:beta-lactamase family protein [Gemmatimonadota bacterium]
MSITRRTRHWFVAVAALTSAACTARGRPSLDDDLDRLLAAYLGDHPGACVLVRHQGTALREHCVGMAELETHRATTPLTNFRLASVTKQFTATAILTLIADGRLDSATTLRQALPGFPPWADGITIHQLLTHTSGLPDYEDLLPADTERQVTDAEVVQLLRAQDSTAFAAGSAYHSRNSGYAL